MKVPDLVSMMIVEGQASPKDYILTLDLEPARRAIVNSLDTYCPGGVSIHVFALLLNAAGESTVVRASTFIDHFSYFFFISPRSRP
jgi:hypothetical protein